MEGVTTKDKPNNAKVQPRKDNTAPKKLTIGEVFGRRVKLKEDFFERDEFIEAVGRGEVKGFSLSKDTPTALFIKKGSEGTIAEGPYSSGIYDYDKEWPVQFDMFSKGVRGYDKQFTKGIPHELLEFIES